MNSRVAIGITIAGLGQAGATPTAATRLRLSTTTRIVGSAHYVAALHGWPRPIETETEPLEGLTTQGSIDISVGALDLPDQQDRQIGRGVLEFFMQIRPQHDLVFSARSLAASTPGAVSVFGVDLVVGGEVPIVGERLFAGREVMWVTAVAGSGATRTINAIRGCFGTEAQAHDQRDPFLFVERNSVTVDREVEMYLLDLETLTEELIWSGIVESYAPNSTLTILNVKARSLLGYVAARSLGEGRFKAPARVYIGSSGGPDTLRIYPRGGDEVVAYKPLYADNSIGLDGGFGKVVPCVAEDVAVWVRMNEVTSPAPDFPWGYRHNPSGGESREIDGQILEFDAQASEVQLVEVLIADRDQPGLIRDAAGARTDHPADIIRCLLASTGSSVWSGGGHIVGTNGSFDWLPGYWGCAFPDALIDHASFDTLVERWPTKGLRAKSFYLGADGDEPKAGETLYDLAQAMNAYLYETPAGKLAIRQLRDPGPDGVDGTLDADDILWVKGAAAGVDPSEIDVSPVYAIELEVGQQGPGGKPARILSAGDLYQAAVSRYRHLADKDVVETTRIYGDIQTYATTLNEIQALASIFLWRYIYLQSQLPSYNLALNSGAERVKAGQWWSVSHPTLWGSSFERGVEAHRCLVLSADWDSETHQQRIKIVDFFFVSGAEEFISPSWQIASVASSTQFTISDQRYSDSDSSLWENAVKYRYDLYTPQGVLRSTDGPQPGTISGIGVTMAAAWTSGAVPVTPLVGDIVRITDYTTSTYTDASWGPDDYLWLADSTGRLGGGLRDPGSNWDV
jgi:hypothetical protein